MSARCLVIASAPSAKLSSESGAGWITTSVAGLAITGLVGTACPDQRRLISVWAGSTNPSGPLARAVESGAHDLGGRNDESRDRPDECG